MPKAYIFYHGTDYNNKDKILKEGLKVNREINWLLPTLSITARPSVAKNYARKVTQYGMTGEKATPRKPLVFKIKLYESDVKFGTSEESDKIRVENLKRAYKEKWYEYEIYKNIPPNRLSIYKG